jgi:probable F420-dependent oxidoreductase
MRLGIHLPQYRDPFSGRELAAAARAAEEAGADDVWVSDHLILPPGSRHPPTAFHDALTVLTWAAAATGRVGLGTSVLVVPYRHPVALAKSLASLDDLSGGRVIAGLASGWMESEFRALGVPFAGRGRRTDAAIAVMRGLWAGAHGYEWLGERVDDVELAPPPARPGGPPVWIGGNSDAGLRRAARLGDAWHTTIHEPDALAERLAALDRELERSGRRRGDLIVSARAHGDPATIAALAPRLAALGVDHLLVSLPAFDPASYGADVAELVRVIRRS